MSQNKELHGKLAIVTGASRGIGSAISENLASKGANLVLNYTSPSSTQRTTDFVSSLHQKYGITAVAVQAKLGDPNCGEILVEEARKAFGADGHFQIDIIINNAGISSNNWVKDQTIEDWTNQYTINVLGPLLLMKAAIPYLPDDRSGRIVNVSSVSATIGLAGQSVYGGTKAALEAMTRSWAREFAENATVNAINPGPVATGMWDEASASDDFARGIRPWNQLCPLAQPMKGQHTEEEIKAMDRLGGRAGAPEEIAGVVGMLCSKDAAWCTGSTVCANGGWAFTKA